MGLQFLLRKYPFASPFRLALCDLMRFEGDTLILSTGYASGSIFNYYNKNDFVDALKEGFKNQTEPEIIVVGGMLEYKEQQQEFNKFLKLLKKEFSNTTFYRAYGDKWHGKIVIKANNKKPVAEIIGCSNLSGAAFGTNVVNLLNFNFNSCEADIYLWDGNSTSIKRKGYSGIKEEEYSSNKLKEERKLYVNGLTEAFIGLVDTENREVIKTYLTKPIKENIENIKEIMNKRYYPIIEERYKDVSSYINEDDDEDEEECRRRLINNDKAGLLNYIYKIFVCDKLSGDFDDNNRPLKSVINGRILLNDTVSILEGIYVDLMDYINICTYEEII